MISLGARGDHQCTRFLRLLLITAICSMTINLHTCAARRVGKCIKEIEGSRCYMPRSSWQHDGVCLLEKHNRGCHIPDSRVFKFSLVAKLRRTKKTPGEKPIPNKMWIRGSGPGLSWDKPLLMQKSARTVDDWQTDISYTYDSNAILCVNTSHCSLNQRALEFRLYRDESGKDGMLGPNFYVPLPVSNSMGGLPGFSQPQVTIYPWFDGNVVMSQEISVQTDKLIATVNRKQLHLKATLLFPPSFEHNIRKTYPLVVMFGTKEPIQIVPLLEHMFVHEASIKESVIVSIHYLDQAPFCSFNPFVYDSYKSTYSKVWRCKSEKYGCANCQTCWDAQRIGKCDKQDFIFKAGRCLKAVECSGNGENILDLIEAKLLPEITKRTQNRLQVKFPTQRMSIVGFDGAGLLACYAALSRPLIYENAGCMSAPFHWPMTSLKSGMNRKIQGMGELLTELNNTIRITPELRLPYTTQKYYIGFGEHDNFFFPVVDAHDYVEWFIKLLQDVLQLEMDKNIFYSVVPGAGNSYYHHKNGGTEVLHRIKTPLLYFLRSEGGPNVDFPRMPKTSAAAFAERKTEIEMSSSNEAQDYTLSLEFNTTATTDHTHCPIPANRKRTSSTSGVPIVVYLLSIGISVTISVLVTVVLMCLREANQKAADEAEKEAELLEELGSSISDFELDS